MQGVPGSGKSTLAKELAVEHDAVICSTDDFFYDENGEYKFSVQSLGENHRKNLDKAKKLMNQNINVIIDNTNILKIHAKPYIDYAKEKNYEIVIVRCNGQYQNIHGVPELKILELSEKMEELEELLH